MVGMKRRTSVQYMPKKPKKFGVKIWVLWESKSGYCLDLKLYKDKGGDNQEPGLAYQVVMDLMRVYLDQNHYLFVDTYPKRFLPRKTKYICQWDNSIKLWPIPRWI